MKYIHNSDLRKYDYYWEHRKHKMHKTATGKHSATFTTLHHQDNRDQSS